MKTYRIHATPSPEISINSTAWQEAPAASVNTFPWDAAADGRPVSHARLLHSPAGLYIKFSVSEYPILARFTQPNDPVCRDSCVEFFFQPDTKDPRYMNFEMNPLGTLLIGLGSSRYDLGYLSFDPEVFAVETLIHDRSWELKLVIPYTFIHTYFKELTNPFKGNLQKCADDAPQPHYACWSPIGTSRPDFHQPAYFGQFELG